MPPADGEQCGGSPLKSPSATGTSGTHALRATAVRVSCGPAPPYGAQETRTPDSRLAPPTSLQ
jgi:hypothetical protein